MAEAGFKPGGQTSKPGLPDVVSPPYLWEDRAAHAASPSTGASPATAATLLGPEPRGAEARAACATRGRGPAMDFKSLAGGEGLSSPDLWLLGRPGRPPRVFPAPREGELDAGPLVSGRWHKGSAGCAEPSRGSGPGQNSVFQLPSWNPYSVSLFNERRAS